ncbi:hypothetical protein BC829DRAFT_107526 [Chytridium lagenaria]|nr:hypothetical protein BC829DRAFT_107526 [Chytridium lagenaria]
MAAVDPPGSLVKKTFPHDQDNKNSQQQPCDILQEASGTPTPISDPILSALQIPCGPPQPSTLTHCPIPTPTLPPAPSPSPSPSTGLTTHFNGPHSLVTVNEPPLSSQPVMATPSGGSQGTSNNSGLAATVPMRLIYASPATSTTLLDDLDDEEGYSPTKSKLLGLSSAAATLDQASEQS